MSVASLSAPLLTVALASCRTPAKPKRVRRAPSSLSRHGYFQPPLYVNVMRFPILCSEATEHYGVSSAGCTRLT